MVEMQPLAIQCSQRYHLDTLEELLDYCSEYLWEYKRDEILKWEMM